MSESWRLVCSISWTTWDWEPVQKIRGSTTLWSHCPSPDGTAPHQRVSWLVVSAVGKGEPRVDMCPAFWNASPGDCLSSQGVLGICKAWPRGSGRDRAGLAATSTQILAEGIPACRRNQAEILLSSSAHLQSWDGLWLESSVCQSCPSVLGPKPTIKHILSHGPCSMRFPGWGD